MKFWVLGYAVFTICIFSLNKFVIFALLFKMVLFSLKKKHLRVSTNIWEADTSSECRALNDELKFLHSELITLHFFRVLFGFRSVRLSRDHIPEDFSRDGVHALSKRIHRL